MLRTDEPFVNDKDVRPVEIAQLATGRRGVMTNAEQIGTEGG
jgi:hypothetical protein